MASEPIVVEQSFPVEPLAVWQAVTNPDLMRQWFFESIDDFRPQVGFETVFDVDSGGRIFRHQWKVIDVVPEESITYTWRFEGFPASVRSPAKSRHSVGLSSGDQPSEAHESVAWSQSVAASRTGSPSCPGRLRTSSSGGMLVS